VPAFCLADKYFTMNKTNIDQALAALADALKSQEPDSFLTNPKEFVKKIPFRSLSGDHINGGKVQNFASAGITDQATRQQLLLKDDGVHITSLTVDKVQDLKINGTLTASIVKTDILEVKEIKADIKFEKDVPIVFSGDVLEGKGLLWSGKGNTKQFIYASNPDRFFSSENLDFARGKSITVNNIKLIDDRELGPTITKSNLKEVGRLNGLIVDGSVSLGQYVYFDNNTNRLGIGTEEPGGAFSVAEDGIEVIIGTTNSVKGYIGTFASHALDIVTDNTPRITISASGNITLGNTNATPVQVSVVGSLGINVNNIDSRANLHVNGAIKFNNKIHLSGRAAPQDGAFNEGDIMWNSEPQPGKFIGWVCTRAGSPGLWSGFGRIE
jgi:hypothetical protein